MYKEPAFNYFKKRDKNAKYGKHAVKVGNVVFVCDNAKQKDLIKKWIKAGDNFAIN